MKRKALTQARVRELLTYNPLTGVLVWNDNDEVLHRVRGQIAGRINHNSQSIGIGMNYTKYEAHVLAWLYMYGYMPKTRIYHLDGNNLNNRLENLSLIPNRPYSSNLLGLRGVSQITNDQYVVVTHGQYIGTFNDPTSASQEYTKAKIAFVEAINAAA